MNKEIEIPEGYEARIEGNKVILEQKESEDERIRKELIGYLTHRAEVTGFIDEDKDCKRWIAYLEKQKEQKHPDGCFTCNEYKKGYEEGRRNGFTAGYNKAMKEVEQKEQKPAESDAIKGGDFISDGKRVFLVLANVKERNLGETYSTFCEGLILGVDGVVYCNGDDFKKYKRATSDERAKFIHDFGKRHSS